MNKKFSWSGVIVVLICLAFMLYYYLIFRHTLESLRLHHPS
jgi:hypothetical protein